MFNFTKYFFFSDVFSEKDEYEKQIIEILKRIYCFDEDVEQYVILDNMEEEVRLGFLMAGEVFNVHIDHLRILVAKVFPRCAPYKRKKTKKYPF